MGIATRDAYGKALAKLIVERDDVIVLDADLTKSTKTCEAQKARPQHHFNMGIAEGNMMSVAAGLAASNKIVYASSFAVFATGRAFEQIRNSICYPNMNVKICATHAGITVGEDGASHQSIEDIALMRAIPNMHVFSPCDARQAQWIVKEVANIQGPCYVRLGRGNVDDVYMDCEQFIVGKGTVLKQGCKIAIFATGLMVQEVLEAEKRLKEKDIYPTIIDIHAIKPIDEALITHIAETHDLVVSCEEHSVIGGLGSAIAEILVKTVPKKMLMIGMRDCFGESGTPEQLLEKYELNAKCIADKVETWYSSHDL